MTIKIRKDISADRLDYMLSRGQIDQTDFNRFLIKKIKDLNERLEQLERGDISNDRAKRE